jgi:hypothetical protein
MKRRLIRRATTLVVFAIAVMLGGRHAFAMYRCAHDHVARASCCCPAKAQRPAPATPTIKASCCCSIEEAKAAAAATAADPVPTLAIRPVTAITIVEPAFVAAMAIAPPREARPPPRPASLFDQHISFLV